MLKTLWAQVGRYKKQAILTPLFTMGEAVLEIAVPLVMASIIDDGIEAGNIGHVYRYGALMVGLAALGLLAGILAGIKPAVVAIVIAAAWRIGTRTLRNGFLAAIAALAFVAIALYFSILKVHPTPFCVMDEIEAALDEANVVRYARYMRTLADKTQFIVITHRRGTMEEADVLYGVTMQEQGVSKILTINMNDLARELKIQ